MNFTFSLSQLPPVQLVKLGANCSVLELVPLAFLLGCLLCGVDLSQYHCMQRKGHSLMDPKNESDHMNLRNSKWTIFAKYISFLLISHMQHPLPCLQRKGLSKWTPKKNDIRGCMTQGKLKLAHCFVFVPKVHMLDKIVKF